MPAFVNEPVMLSGALALWLGICAYLTIIERTPRAYIFVLSGYTTSIIGFPAVADPAHVFDIAATRVQEISIGLACGTLLHAFVLPTTVTSAVVRRLDEVLDAAVRWSRDGLTMAPASHGQRDRLHLITELGELETLATHLPFDTAARVPDTRTLRALQSRFLMVLPLVNTVEQRLHSLQQMGKPLPSRAAQLLEQATRWMGSGSREEAQVLLVALGQVRESLLAGTPAWSDLVAHNALTRLNEWGHRAGARGGGLDGKDALARRLKT